MNSVASLTGAHLRTYTALFQIPAAEGLDWIAIDALLDDLADVERQPKAGVRVTRNGHSLSLRLPRESEVAGKEEVMVLRDFLDRSEEPPPRGNGREPHLIVVIDGHEVRLFRTEVTGGVPERILPHEATDFFHQARNASDFTDEKEKPATAAFFVPLAEALSVAGQILIFGTSTGAGSEMDQFLTWAGQNRPDLARRIVGSAVVENSLHLTDVQLLDKARSCYAAGAKSGV